MTPTVQVLHGSALDQIRTLPECSVQCCVTSPPYWGLRSYLPDGHPLKPHEIGLERTPDEYLQRMVEVFREVRRVLCEDGTCWVNMGDCYNTRPCTEGTSFRRDRLITVKGKRVPRGKGHRWGGGDAMISDLKPKDLVGMPWRLALALQADGWWLRADIIWHKPNPMPESVTDRPTKSHEYIFLLTKSPTYFYDAEAIREPVSPNTHARLSQNVEAQIGSARANGGGKTNGAMKAVVRGSTKAAQNAQGSRQNESFRAAACLRVSDRNKRSVWTVPTYGFSDAHFATFPPDLIRPCIRAGSRPGDTILDPFGGSGTTGQVALEEGRSAILIELNPDYLPLIDQRTNVTPALAL